MSEAISVLNPSKPRKHGKHKARRKLSGTSVVMVPSGGRYVAGHVVKNNPAHKRRRIKLRRNPAADMKGAALGAVGVLLVLGADAAVHKFIPETMLGKARGFIAPAVGLAGGFLGAGFVGPAVAAGLILSGMTLAGKRVLDMTLGALGDENVDGLAGSPPVLNNAAEVAKALGFVPIPAPVEGFAGGKDGMEGGALAVSGYWQGAGRPKVTDLDF